MNPSRRMLRPSGTWLVIAAVGVVAVGSAVGADDMAKKKSSVFSPKQTSRIVMISRAQANSRINARAHTLSVKSAKTAESAKTADVATTAKTAESVAGTTSFTLRLSWGQTQTIATNGPVSLVAQCIQTDATSQNRVQILGATTVENSFQRGTDDLRGPGQGEPFLQPSTPEANRRLISYATTVVDQPVATSYIDQGFVAAPDGTMIRMNTESVVLALNTFGANCFVKGEAYTN